VYKINDLLRTDNAFSNLLYSQ